MARSHSASSTGARKKASMNDVAAAAGVSKTTVSRYLHGEFGYMSEQTRARLAAVIEQLEYRPNKMAQGLKATFSNMIGVTIADIANPFSSQLLKGIQAVCRKEGLQLLVCDVDDRPALERSAIESLIDAQVDGIIVNTVGANDEYLVQYCSSADAKPIVLLDRTTQQEVCDSIVTDNQGAVFEMLKYLQGQGFEQVVFVTRPIEGVTTRTVRVQAVQDWCNLYKMQCSIVVTDLQEQSSDGVANDVIRAIEQMQAEHGVAKLCVFTNNEETTRYVLATMPQVTSGEFGLCGFAEQEWARFSGPGITCLDQDPVRMGQAAAQQLIARIRERQAQHEGAVVDVEPYHTTYIPASLHVFASTERVK